jgi:hypothetical protein
MIFISILPFIGYHSYLFLNLFLITMGISHLKGTGNAGWKGPEIPPADGRPFPKLGSHTMCILFCGVELSNVSSFYVICAANYILC